MPEVTSLRPGDPQTLGAYRLTGRLGEGGQGIVFLGQGRDGTSVAVKVLRGRWAADRRLRERFAKEVAAARRVAPFCVAQVLDADLESAQPYIVTEFVDGPTLREAVTVGGPRSGPALHRLAVATATALAAIHEAGVVHRDFKPANVLLGSDGPRVIDFGIARTLDAGTQATGGVVGTPTYMAPEQFAAHDIGPPADVFAWGCVMVFAATGAPPFGGDNVAAISYRVLHEQPDLGHLADPLRDLVSACLSKNPAARPSMREVLLRLLGNPDTAPIEQTLDQGRQAVLAVVPPPHRPAGSWPTVPAHRRTNRRAAAAGAGAVVAVAAIAAAVILWPGTDRRGGGGRPTTPTPSASGAPAGVQVTRSPRLGLEFWQDGRPSPTVFGQRGGKDVVTVTLRPAPFEFRFPKPPDDVAVQMCAWTDDSIFSLRDGESVQDVPFYRLGTGIADYEYGSGTLYLNKEGHNYLGGTRVQALSATEDKVYFAQTWIEKQATPLQQRRDDIFLTVFIDKNKDQKLKLAGPGEYEYVILRFQAS
ncbi:hypothetical protein GCM10029978_052210 [Actinoallomurus acanthiterrae]